VRLDYTRLPGGHYAHQRRLQRRAARRHLLRCRFNLEVDPVDAAEEVVGAHAECRVGVERGREGEARRAEPHQGVVCQPGVQQHARAVEDHVAGTALQACERQEVLRHLHRGRKVDGVIKEVEDLPLRLRDILRNIDVVRQGHKLALRS
jgi:hypothetical protein